MEDKLKQIEKFFKYDLKIKQILHECVLKEEESYNKDYLIIYKDKLYKSLKNIEFYIQKIIDMYFNNDTTKNIINNRFKSYYISLDNCPLEKQKLKKLYQVIFSDMDFNLITKLGTEYCGYLLFKNYNIINEASTINEMLHICHHVIVNDESIYQSMPKINQKENNAGCSINLYGKSNDIAERIYNAFPKELECGDTEIISLEDKILIMIRDVGHALTIEMTIEGNEIIVNYYIPKICNVDMVNNLRGIDKVNNESKYTIGMFVEKTEKIEEEIIKFISMVPSDMDMISHKSR